MATVTSGDRTTSPPSSPQLRVIGFTTSSTASGANEEHYDCSSASPHSLPESPLSRLLRSATWPNLRLRLCKSEIPGAAELSGGLKCRVERSCSEQDCCASRHGRSSSPISIPQMYSCSMVQETQGATGTPLMMLSNEAVHLAHAPSQTEQPSSALSFPSAECDLDFAAACWVLE